MRKTNTYIIVLGLTLFLFSCSDNRQKTRDSVIKKIEMLTREQDEWNDLTNRILSDGHVNSNLGKLINPDDLNESLKSELLNKGVIRVAVDKEQNCQAVDYHTNWTKYPLGSICLTWTSCDSVKTKKGYYEDNFDFNFIEVWGVGNNFLIVTDSDFI